MRALTRRPAAAPPLSIPKPIGSVLDRVSAFKQGYEKSKVQSRPRTDNLKDKVKKLPGVAYRTAGVMAGSAAFGVIQGRYGSVKKLGLPVDLAAGFLGHGIAFWMGGDFEPLLQNVADGCFAAYANTWGRGLGRDMRERARLPPLKVAGSMGAMPLIEASGGSALSSAELEQLQERL